MLWVGSHHWQRCHLDGSKEGEVHSRVTTANQGSWTPVIPWVGQLLPTIDPWLLSHYDTFDQLVEEGPIVRLEWAMSWNLWGLQEGYNWGARLGFTRLFQAIWTSDFAIGGVLMQDAHPIAYESQKLNEMEKRYTVQEKKMMAAVHCLKIWRHHLLESRFMVITNRIDTSYFQT